MRRWIGNAFWVLAGSLFVLAIAFTAWCHLGESKVYVLGFRYDPSSPPQLRGKTAPRLLDDHGEAIRHLESSAVSAASPYIDVGNEVHGKPTLFYPASPNWTFGNKTFLMCQFEGSIDSR